MTDVLVSILAKLDADAPLRALLGGADRVWFGHLSQAEAIPGVYLTGGDTDTSTPRLGYRETGIRDNNDTVQVDAWALTPELCRDLVKRIDPILFAGVTGTDGWLRIGGMAPDRDPDRPELWHATARYSFNYPIQDI